VIPLPQAHKILAAVGIVRADNEAQQLATRILYDPLVAARTNEFIFSGAGAAPEALAALHPLEKSALFARLRIAGGAPAAAPRGNTNWFVSRSPVRGQLHITASCPACAQLMKFQPLVGAGHLPKDFVFSHCGQNETCPDKAFFEWQELAHKRPVVVDFDPRSPEEKVKDAAEDMARQDRATAARLVGENDPQLGPKVRKANVQ